MVVSERSISPDSYTGTGSPILGMLGFGRDGGRFGLNSGDFSGSGWGGAGGMGIFGDSSCNPFSFKPIVCAAVSMWFIPTS